MADSETGAPGPRQRLALGGLRRAVLRVPKEAAIAGATVVGVFAVMFLMDWRLPGLYMDAINPEYWIPGILDPPAALRIGVPGNVIGDRFPVFTGTIYHGSVQLYAALPFMALFGTGLGALRAFQLLVGIAIILLGLRMATHGTGRRGLPIAIGATGLMALDPSLVWGLRTQVYSLHFSLLLLLGAVVLIYGHRASARPGLRVLVAGIFYGLSVFGYFVFAFFFPAMVWLLWRAGGEAARARFSARLSSLWLAGCAAGYAPFFLGVELIRRELGGIGPALAWFRQTSSDLDATGAGLGPLDRVEAWAESSSRAATGEWPWLAILGSGYGGLLDILKVVVLIAVPAVVLGFRSGGTPAQRHAVGAPLALVGSYMVCALPLGGRLDGHHFLSLVPLLYVAFGAAVAVICLDPSWRMRLHVARRGVAPAAGAVLALLVALPSVINHAQFTSEVRATGGVALYSDSIDLFARQVAVSHPGATVHSPDWGFAFPLTFLGGPERVLGQVDAAAISGEACEGIDQLVLFRGTANGGRFRLIAELAGRPIESVTTWSQRDGVPVFQVASFAGDPACETSDGDGSPAPVEGPGIIVEPRGLPACSFLAPTAIVRVGWSTGSTEGTAEVYVEQSDGRQTLWTTGPSLGRDETGPWATAGTSFVLRAAGDGRELARTTIGRTACPVA